MGITLSYNGLGGKVKFSGTSGRFKTKYIKPSLLEYYPGAAAAYSLRKLSGNYTGAAIRVSRSSDNTETDIGFNADGSLNTTALLSFVGSSNGRIATWYDQSGNGRNATQATAGNQPVIVLAGTLYTLNGKPSVYWDKLSSQNLVTSNFASAISQPISTYTVSRLPSSSFSGAAVICDSSTTTGFALLHGGTLEPPPGTSNLFMNSGNSVAIETTDTATKLVSVLYNTTNTNAFVNGVQKVTNQNIGSNSLGGVTIGNIRLSGFYSQYSFYGWISELVFYPSLQTANNTGIQNNINSFYSIYWQGTGTALLDLYPSAAAAYSLRNLSSTYTGPLVRVRRSSDNAEIDIYGTFAGVLDTTALTTFVGAGNGFIKTWYDQSGNGNNATQVTAGNQPTIVDSGVLVTENTKPSINFSGDRPLPLTTIISSNTNLSIFAAQRTKTVTSWSVILGHNSGGGSGPFFGITNTNKYNINIAINGVSKNGASVANAGISFNILNTIVNSVDAYPYINNTLIPITLSTWTPSTTDFSQIGKYFSYSSDSNISELIVYKTDQTTSRSNITSNINSYYTIY